MPKQYTAIRDKFIREGMGEKAAKTHAAKIYNSTHHSAPVTGSYDSESGGGRDNRENRSRMMPRMKKPGLRLPSLGGKLFRKGKML